MSTSSELKAREIASNERIADAKRRQQERSDDRSAKVNFFGHSMKALSSLGKMNDASWYKSLPDGEKVNASIPDFQTIGTEDGAIAQDNSVVKLNVPAVVRINYGPTIGNTRNFQIGSSVIMQTPGNDYMNRAINRICTQLEQRNSRVATYSRDTIGRYLFIVTDIVCSILRIKTALDVFDMSDSFVPFVARQLIRALGFNYADFKTNVSAYRSEYVSLVEDFNKGLPLPRDLSFLKRQMWLSHTIVKDTKGVSSTYLVFHRGIGYSFEPSPSSTPDIYYAHPVGFDGSWIQFASYTSNIKKSMQYLINGATWKPLIRDIRGGIKSDSWLILSSDVDKKSVNITDYDEVRSQIHNLTSVPYVECSASNIYGLVTAAFNVGGDANEAVRQDASIGYPNQNANFNEYCQRLHPGSILFDFSSASALTAWQAVMARHMPWDQFQTGRFFGFDYVLDNYGKASTDNFLVSSRLKMGYAYGSFTVSVASGDPGYQLLTEASTLVVSTTGDHRYGYVSPVQYGTEVVLSIQCLGDMEDKATMNTGDVEAYMTAEYQFYNLSDWEGACVEFTFTTDVYQSNSTGAIVNARVLQYLSTIDWAPIISWYMNSASGVYKYTIGELDKYTTFKADVMGKLHGQALQSEFTLPETIYLKPLA